jgi:hypothetical protein
MQAPKGKNDWKCWIVHGIYPKKKSKLYGAVHLEAAYGVQPN